MSNEEFNNRNYYRGRFVSKVIDKRGKIIINNWEETLLK